LGPWDKPLIAPDRLTVGKLLQQHGYATACIGKWHLGQTYSTNDGEPPIGGAKNALGNVNFSNPITDGPIARGFDHYFGTIVPNYPPYCFIEDDHTVGIPSVPTEGGNFKIPGPMVPSWKLENILPELTRHAVRWVEDTAKSKKPFFLYFSLTSPHFPVVPAPQFIGKSKAGEYGDFVHQTDWTIGQVLEALEENLPEEEEPSEKMLDALDRLLLELCRVYNIPAENVIGHFEVRQYVESQTGALCPGKNLKEKLMKLRKNLCRS
jgi:arylsulfatase A-like enzyme